MRVAVISDIHGNSVALDHVLQEIESLNVDQVVCLGDIATLGPQPVAVIKRLRELDCVCILGNHDDFMIDLGQVREYSKVPVVIQSVEWCHSLMSADDLEFFKRCVPEYEIQAGKVRLRFFHGSPTSHSEDIMPNMSAGKLDQLVGQVEGDVLVFGHTHLQMLIQHQGRYVLNPGSLGAPFKEVYFCEAPTVFRHAEYAIIDASDAGIEISLKRTYPDREKLLASVRDSNYPLKQFLLAQYSK